MFPNFARADERLRKMFNEKKEELRKCPWLATRLEAPRHEDRHIYLVDDPDGWVMFFEYTDGDLVYLTHCDIYDLLVERRKWVLESNLADEYKIKCLAEIDKWLIRFHWHVEWE